ncbi:MAG: glycosyltransferase family 4 protein [Bacteroidota bacterium]
MYIYYLTQTDSEDRALVLPYYRNMFPLLPQALLLMHILHISSARTWRGGEQQIAYLIEELQTQYIQQTSLCVKGAPFANWCRAQDIPCITYKKRSSIDWSIAKQIKRIVKEEKVTHLHAHDSHAHTFAVLAATFFGMRKPIILSRRVDFSIKKNFFSHWKYNHSSVKKIICISHNIKKIVQESIKDQTKLKVVHSGIQPEKFTNPKAVKNRLRKEYQIDEDKKIIANVAALADHKDYPTFVNTAEILSRKRSDLQFLIIGGDAGEKDKIRQLIKDKNLESCVLLTGFRNDIPEIFPELDLLLFTSKEEGLGTTVLDAFASNVPVVATEAGGIPEMVIHRKTGWLAPIGNAQQLSEGVEQVLDNKSFRDDLIVQSKLHLQEFTSKKMASAILAIYNTVL